MLVLVLKLVLKLVLVVWWCNNFVNCCSAPLS